MPQSAYTNEKNNSLLIVKPSGFRNPEGFTITLEHAFCQHGICHLDEAGHVGADHQVAFLAALLGSIVGAVENVDRFLHFNFSGNERWQSHRPLESVKFENIKATGVGMPLTAYGSAETPVTLTMRNLDVSFRDDVENTAFLHVANFDRILLENVNIQKNPDAPLVKSWTEGGQIIFRNVNYAAPEDQWVNYTDEPFVCKSI